MAIVLKCTVFWGATGGFLETIPVVCGGVTNEHNFHVQSFRKSFISSKVKIKSRNEFGFSPETEMGLMRTFDAYYQDQPKIVKDEKKSSEFLYKTFGNSKGIHKLQLILSLTLMSGELVS